MNRPLLLAALLLGACNDPTFTGGEAEVLAAPPVLDVGVVMVGLEVSGRVTLNVKNGVASVLDVNVLPTLGGGFVYEGDPSFAIDADAANGFDLIFRPTEAGYASALVQITTDAREPVVEIEVRGRAIDAALVATPSIVDLGVVPAGTTGSRLVTIEDVGDIGVDLAGASGSVAGLSVDAAFPVSIRAHESVDLAVVYTAPTDAPMLGLLSFAVGTATVPGVVIVRANDCERGLPEAYDLDLDGVTSCGGDCDDDDAGVGPGRLEKVNGVDDDCNGRVDDHTDVYDDDGDGFCEGPTCLGAARPGDCLDGDASASPGATEDLTNGRDDNCDGVIDPSGTDVDRDGFAPEGGDCDDANPTVHPGAPEDADGIDDDCDGLIDNRTAVYDDDGDGWCESPTRCVGGARPGDCADADPARSPTGVETGNFVDDDCDGRVDEGTNRGDDDGDGFTEVGGDCDDADPDVNPARGGCP